MYISNISLYFCTCILSRYHFANYSKLLVEIVNQLLAPFLRTSSPTYASLPSLFRRVHFIIRAPLSYRSSQQSLTIIQRPTRVALRDPITFGYKLFHNRSLFGAKYVNRPRATVRRNVIASFVSQGNRLCIHAV